MVGTPGFDLSVDDYTGGWHANTYRTPAWPELEARNSAINNMTYLGRGAKVLHLLDFTLDPITLPRNALFGQWRDDSWTCWADTAFCTRDYRVKEVESMNQSKWVM